MSSKAFFKSSMKPQLIHRFHQYALQSKTGSQSSNDANILKKRERIVIEIWKTSCIVTNFGKKVDATVLINPSNPELSGVKNFPYFPRGGPVPKEKPMSSMHKDWQPLGYVSQWGGMEVGTGMLYPVSVIDGLVHQLGGMHLTSTIAMKRLVSFNKKELCPIGKAVETSISSSSELSNYYDSIIHTTPPFYKYYDCEGSTPEQALQSCYKKAFDLAFSSSAFQTSTKVRRVAVPLIGAGARGFPEDVALRIAASESIEWMNMPSSCNSDNDNVFAGGDDDREEVRVVAFGLLEQKLADELAELIEWKNG